MAGGKIYLIGQSSDGNLYKIGRTRRPRTAKRIVELQTGNPVELFVVREFETDCPARIESMLHRMFMDKKELNEWFRLDDDDVLNFIETCEKCQKIMDSLEGNPFFKKL